jgi:hypothetical protein
MDHGTFYLIHFICIFPIFIFTYKNVHWIFIAGSHQTCAFVMLVAQQQAEMYMFTRYNELNQGGAGTLIYISTYPDLFVSLKVRELNF